MEFKKYNSIENSYRAAFIERWVNNCPELLLEKFIVTEKIHGANFSIMITKDSIEYGKRTSKLESGESFFDWENVVVKYEDIFKKIQLHLISEGLESIRLFGELFGSNIQKGVDYGREKQIRIFDAYINENMLTQSQLIDLLNYLEIFEMFVPIIGIFDSLEEALSVDITFNSTLNNLDDNICEGVVIKPFDKLYKSTDGTPFYLKKKNEKFSEKNRSKKVVTDFSKSKEYQKEIEVYTSYLNTNRLDSIFSKFGRIEEPSQIGKYIKYMLDDAKDDYLKDNKDAFLNLTEKERGKLFSVTGSMVVPMLKEVL